MAYSNKGNNKDKKDFGVNTRGMQLKNKNGLDPSTVIFGFWNDMFTVKIHPALSKEKQTQEQIYDYEHALQTAISIDKVKTLYDNFKLIEDAIENQTQCTVGVTIGTNSVFVISTGPEGAIRPFIAIYKELDPDTNQAGQGIRYEFNIHTFTTGYNPETGKIYSTEPVSSELGLFKEMLNSTISALSNANTHSWRNVQNFFNTKQMDTVSALAEKMGVDTNRGGYSKTSNSSAFSMAPGSVPDAPIIDSNLDDDLPF